MLQRSWIPVGIIKNCKFVPSIQSGNSLRLFFFGKMQIITQTLRVHKFLRTHTAIEGAIYEGAGDEELRTVGRVLQEEQFQIETLTTFGD